MFMLSNHPDGTAEQRAMLAGALSWLVKARTTARELAQRLTETLRESGEETG